MTTQRDAVWSLLLLGPPLAVRSPVCPTCQRPQRSQRIGTTVGWKPQLLTILWRANNTPLRNPYCDKIDQKKEVGLPNTVTGLQSGTAEGT